MPNAFILIFDRTLDAGYKKFHEDLVSMPDVSNWWHYIKSSYILITKSKVEELSPKIRALFEKHGLSTTHLLVSANLDERQGMLTKDAWEWLKKNEDCGYS